MAFDKVVDSSVLDNGLTQIADAIREKGGTTDELTFPTGFAAAIENIQSGGDTSAEDGIVDRTLTGTYNNDRITEVGTYVFYNSKITNFDFPNVTKIVGYAFTNSAEMVSINAPKVTYIGSYAFQSCSKLESISFPKLLNASTAGSVFRSCTALSEVNLPLLTSIGSYFFYGCTALVNVKLPSLTSTNTYAFYTCKNLSSFESTKLTSIKTTAFASTALSTLIIRNTTKCCELAATSAFSGTPIASGTGYIYVPSSLIDSYKSATNWSTYASQFRALEDYTVDGTSTGELDESKI